VDTEPIDACNVHHINVRIGGYPGVLIAVHVCTLMINFALGIIFTWLYNSAGGSVLIAMVAHLFSNVMTATMRPLFSPADQERYWLIMVAAECLSALGLLIATRGRLGLKPANERAVASWSGQ
jgi:hypothetical protein